MTCAEAEPLVRFSLHVVMLIQKTCIIISSPVTTLREIRVQFRAQKDWGGGGGGKLVLLFHAFKFKHIKHLNLVCRRKRR